MDSRGVMTLVSDSGVTRYRIVAESWQKYDAADPPYQEFKEGIYLEQFAEDLSVKASLKADYAYYNERDERWRLDGNVVAVNREGERFETPQLLWDQQTELIRTDSVITITKKSSVITGVGMVSNQDMSEYTILNPTGYFPIDEQ